MGLNLNFWTTWNSTPQVGPERGHDYPIYENALFDWYQRKNVKSARVMFTWEAVQSNLRGPIPPTEASYHDYWTDFISVVKRLLDKHIYVTLEPWGHNLATNDTGIKYKNMPFNAADFESFWGAFAAGINRETGNDQRVAFGLMNEPHTPDVELEEWFIRAQAAINGIRQAGATNTIFVPGMNYTDANSFIRNGSDAQWLILVDSLPVKNLAVTVHCYSAIDSPIGTVSPTILSDSCKDVVEWARNHDAKVQIAEIAIDAGPNGTPTFAGDSATATRQWADWKRFCDEWSDVLIGWNWWSCSEAGDWSSAGDSTDGKHWGLTLDDGATQTVYMDLIQSSLA